MKHFKYRTFNRLRHSRKFLKWLSTQATRLGVTAKVVFDTYLVGQKLSMKAIEQLAPAPVNAVFTVTSQLPPNRIFQRLTETGGDVSKGTGTIPVSLNVTSPGAVRARLRSSDGTTILGYSNSVNVASNGAQTVQITGVSARLGQFFLDLTGDGTNYTNGTTLVGMGRLIVLAGQSQQVRMITRLDPGATATFATLGITPNANSAVLASFQSDVSTGNSPTSPTTPVVPTWTIPADNDAYFSGAGSVQLMNREILTHGVNVGVIGHAVGGSVISQWQPGGAFLNQLISVITLAGGAEAAWFHLGGTDSGLPTSTAVFKAGVEAVFAAITAANTARGNNYQKFGTGPAYRNTGAENMQNVNAIRVGMKQALAGMTRSVYYEPQNYHLGDSVHETPLGGIQLANQFNRRSNAQLAGRSVMGPVVTGGVRSGATVTLNVQMPPDATALVQNASGFARFMCYPTGTVPNSARTGGFIPTAATIVKVSDTLSQIVLTLDATPTTAIDLYLYQPRAASGDGENNIILDNFVADGVAYGRQVESTTNTDGPILIAA